MGSIHAYLHDDHRRLDGLLEEATREPGRIDPEPFAKFRKGLLRHIGLEEKVLFSAARKARGGVNVEGFDRLRADHARLTALLVPTPTAEIVAEIRSILGPHNELEEQQGGVYDACEALTEGEAAEILEKLRTTPEPPVRPHQDARTPLLLKD